VKVLRVLRRRKIKLSFIFLLMLVFIINTYAWMSTDKETEMGSLVLNVDDWNVAFIIDDQEIKTEEYTIEIDEFYPGITTEEDPIVKQIDVYNIGEGNTILQYEITDIYLYGEHIYNIESLTPEYMLLSVPETVGEVTTTDGITGANLFGNSEAIVFKEEQNRTAEEKEKANYTFSLRYPTPFTITYEYEETYIQGKDKSDGASSWMRINLAWENNEENNIEDTKLGNMVYSFENAKDENGNLINGGEPALRIKARITAKRYFD